jgi:spore maturation protein CgeB
MRVFVLCSTDWIYTLPLGFKEAGYEIRKSGPIFEDKLIKQMDEFRPDLVISMGWTEDQSIERQLLAKKVTKALGVPHVYWSVEDPNYTSDFSLPLIERVEPDFVFSICKETVDLLRKQDIKAGYLDFGYSNLVHYPITSNEKKEYSIIVVANAYVDILKNYPNHFRHDSYKTLITPLLEEGIKIDFWGSEWEKAKDILGVDIPKEHIHGYIPYLNTN